MGTSFHEELMWALDLAHEMCGGYHPDEMDDMRERVEALREAFQDKELREKIDSVCRVAISCADPLGKKCVEIKLLRRGLLSLFGDRRFK